MRQPSISTILIFLAFAFEEVAAQRAGEQVEKLPVCAQACITSAFSTCKCRILDFTCACNCETFRPFSESCTDTSCADSYLQPVLDALDGTCKSLATSTSKVSATPTVQSSSSLSSLNTISITSTDSFLVASTASSEDSQQTITKDAFTSDVLDPNIAGSIDGPTQTWVPGDPSTPVTNPSDGVVSVATSTGSELYTSTSTTAHATYCHPGFNETGRGWNGSAVCTSLYTYTLPAYTGNQAVARVRGRPWVVSLILFFMGISLL